MSEASLPSVCVAELTGHKLGILYFVNRHLGNPLPLSDVEVPVTIAHNDAYRRSVVAVYLPLQHIAVKTHLMVAGVVYHTGEPFARVTASGLYLGLVADGELYGKSQVYHLSPTLDEYRQGSINVIRGGTGGGFCRYHGTICQFFNFYYHNILFLW